MTRRDVLCALGAGAVGAWAAGCSGSRGAGEVVLYSSVDDFVLREVVGAFESASSLRVKLLGDTEATKTTGLIERLVAERERPVADVWWSSEPFGTIRLAGLGLLEPTGFVPTPPLDPALAGKLAAPDGSWFGFALRARVIGVRDGRFEETEIPRTLGDLAGERFRGRVGMARPRFGTTRGHMSAIAATHGTGALRTWLLAMRENGLRIYDGNSSVVRAIADAEIDAGLTDTDDVWAAQRNKWPVRGVYETASPETGVLASPGPMLIPNTVARVLGGPNGANARRLIEFLIEGPAEEILARSDSHNLPVRHGPFPDLGAYDVPGGWMPDLVRVAALDVEAMAVCDDVLGEG